MYVQFTFVFTGSIINPKRKTIDVGQELLLLSSWFFPFVEANENALTFKLTVKAAERSNLWRRI